MTYLLLFNIDKKVDFSGDAIFFNCFFFCLTHPKKYKCIRNAGAKLDKKACFTSNAET